MSNKKSTGAYLQGMTRVLMDVTTGLTDVVEAMHQRIVHPPFLPSTPIQHLITDIAGVTYKNIRWGTQLIGGNLDNVFGKLAPILGSPKATEEGAAIRAALNGVVGDYLEEKGNPLKIDMQFRYLSKTISLEEEKLKETYPAINGKILLMVHGSCMNDLQWTRKEHNHGLALATALGKTPVYLHYNSGRHISTNGQDLNGLLEELVQHWPVPIEDLVILGHSMGGLVARSALHYGISQQQSWTSHLKKIVFLGTPHHGSSLERTGNYLDAILETIPYTKPLARLGKIRSAGVTDLRYGNLRDEDWQDHKQFAIKGDPRQCVPLPKQIDAYSIAAALAKHTATRSPQIIGDGLVDVKSALGQHKDATKHLGFKEEHTWVAYGHSHLDLLNSSAVYTKVKGWLIVN